MLEHNEVNISSQYPQTSQSLQKFHVESAKPAISSQKPQDIDICKAHNLLEENKNLVHTPPC